MSDHTSLQGKVIVITGASSGIGHATALEFAGHGTKIAIAARRNEKLDEVAFEVRSKGSQAEIFLPDVSDEKAVQALAAALVKKHCGVEVWINNAAVFAVGSFEEIPPDVFSRVIEVNLLGEVNGTRAALWAVRKQGAGVMINVSSVICSVPQPYATPYIASKFGIAAYPKRCRKSWTGRVLKYVM